MYPAKQIGCAILVCTCLWLGGCLVMLALLSGCATWDNGAMNVGPSPVTEIQVIWGMEPKLRFRSGADQEFDCNSFIYRGKDGGMIEIQGLHGKDNKSAVRQSAVGPMQQVPLILDAQGRVVGQVFGGIANVAGAIIPGGIGAVMPSAAVANQPASLIDNVRATIQAQVEAYISERLKGYLQTLIPATQPVR